MNPFRKNNFLKTDPDPKKKLAKKLNRKKDTIKPLIVNSKKNPRYKAYQDSLALYNNAIELHKALKNQGYNKGSINKLNKAVIKDNKTVWSKSGKALRDPKNVNKKWNEYKNIARKQNLSEKIDDNLEEVLDFIPTIVNPTLPKQIFSDNIDPQSLDHYYYPKKHPLNNIFKQLTFTSPSQEEMQKYNEEHGDYRPGDARVVANYTNAKPKQKVIVRQESKKEPVKRLVKRPVSAIDINTKNSHFINKDTNIKKEKLDTPFYIKNYDVTSKSKSFMDGENEYSNSTRQIIKTEKELNDYIKREEALNHKVIYKPNYARKNNTFKNGGILNTTNMIDKELNQYNEGGTHDKSPIGGIPQGVGSNGKLNLVEEGETSFNINNNKYIFSNSLDNMKKSTIQEFNLPSYVKGKTFAEASKLIDKKFEGKADKASLKTKQELMERLAQAQEYKKMQQSMAINATEVDPATNVPPAGVNEFALGGLLSKAVGALGGAGGAGGGGLMSMAGNLLSGSKDKGTGMVGNILSGAASGASLGIPGIIGGAALSVLGANKAQKEALNQDRMEGQAYANQNNIFKYGGNMYNDGGKVTPAAPLTIHTLKMDQGKVKPFELTTEIDTSIKPTVYQTKPSFLDSIGNTIGDVGKAIGGAATEINDFLKKPETKESLNKLARKAPIAMNALQLMNLEKPQYERLDRLDNRYQKQLVDEMQLQNQVTNQFNSTGEALANASGGNTASLRANILANSLNRNKALSNAYLQANQMNQAENRAAQQFNLGVNTTNLQQANLENDINQRNLGAYQTQKSKLMSSLGENIGAIGKENQQMEQVARMYGYTWDGKYLRDKNGNVVSKEELEKKKTTGKKIDFSKLPNFGKSVSSKKEDFKFDLGKGLQSLRK